MFKLNNAKYHFLKSNKNFIIFLVLFNILIFISYAYSEVSLIKQQDSYYWYQQAKYFAINRKNYEKALTYCEKALELNPDNLHAKELKEWLVIRINQINEIKKQKELLKQQKEKEKDKTKEVSIEKKDTQEALIINEEELNNVYYYKALSKLTEGDFESASEFFKKDIVENPNRIESWFYLFKYEKDNGNEDVALFYLKKLNEKILTVGKDKIDPNILSDIKKQCLLYQDEAILQIGMYKYNLDVEIKNMIKGGYNWNAISQIPKTNEITLTHKLLTQIDINKLKELDLIPKNFSTPKEYFSLNQIGLVTISKDSFKKRAKIEIPNLKPSSFLKANSDIEKLIQSGDYYANIKIYDRALAFYNEALNRMPDSPIANNNKGVVLKEMGKFKEAIEYFKKAISYDKAYVEAYNNLASIYAKFNNTSEALKLYLIALKLNPKEAYIHFNIGMLYLKNNKLDEAREYINQAIELNPSDPAFYYNLAIIDLKKNNFKSAYKNLKKVSNMVPRDSELYTKIRDLISTIENN